MIQEWHKEQKLVLAAQHSVAVEDLENRKDHQDNKNFIVYFKCYCS